VSKPRQPRPSRKLARKIHQRLAKSQAAVREREERDLRRLGLTRDDFKLTPEEVQGLESHAAALTGQQAPQPAEPPRSPKASQRLPKREVDDEELLAAIRVRYAAGDHPNVNVVAKDVQKQLGVRGLRDRIRKFAVRQEFDGLRGEPGVRKRR
jgi:hypothetical protein